MNPWAFKRLSEVRSEIKANKVLPTDIFREFRKQSELVNYRLNAIVADRWDEGFFECQKIEKEFKETGKLPEFCGLPFTTKEMVAVKGMPLTVGHLGRKSETAFETAPFIERVEKSGGVLAGVTNVPELGFWFESDNLVYGRTNNPYSLMHSPGGSSGGEGSIIAAGGSFFGVGSDIGGSIRIPAAFCGIFGHKPTRRLIPLTGHYPITTENISQHLGESYRVSTVGPMARFADDLIELFKNLAQPDGFDTEVLTYDHDWSPVNWKGKEVYLLDNPKIKMVLPVQREVEEATYRAAKHFESLGASIVSVKNDEFHNAFEIWSSELSQVKGVSFNKSMGLGEDPNLLIKFSELLMLKPTHTVPVLVYALMEKLFKNSSKLKEAHRELMNLRTSWNERLGKGNILLFPSHPRTAFVHHTAKFRPFDFIYTGLFNALDFPATNVPMGFDSSYLPIGVQVIGSQFNDALTLKASSELERAYGGWRPPPKF